MENKPTLVQRVLNRIENHPITAGILLITMLVAGVGSFFTNIEGIFSSFTPKIQVINSRLDYIANRTQKEVLAYIDLKNRSNEPISLTHIRYTANRQSYDREKRKTCPPNKNNINTNRIIPTNTTGTYSLSLGEVVPREKEYPGGYSIGAKEPILYTLKPNSIENITIKFTYAGPGTFGNFIFNSRLIFDDGYEVKLDPLHLHLERICES